MRIYAIALMAVIAFQPAEAQPVQQSHFNDPALESEMAKSMLYPTVQVLRKTSIGSGTIIFSGYLDNATICTVEAALPHPDGACDASMATGKQIRTYVFTNWHVVKPDPPEPAKKSEKKTKKKTDGVVNGAAAPASVTVVVHMTAASSSLDAQPTEYRATVVAHDEKKDIALLSIEQSPQMAYVAHLAPRDVALQPFRPVWALGSPMGYGPIPTQGILGVTHESVGESFFFLSTAPVYGGNSGGGLYHFSNDRNLFEMVGMTVAVAAGPYGPVPHIALSISTEMLHAFIDAHGLRFLEKQELPQAP